MTRGGFRGRRAPGGAFGGVSTGMSLATRRAWATRAVASADVSPPSKARSKPGVSPPRARYPRAGGCGEPSLLAFLGQMSSSAQCPRAPHAWQLVRLLSSARRFLRSSKDRLLPLFLPLPLAFPLPLLLPLPLPLNRCHATMATASNCRASANASSALGLRPRCPEKRRGPSHGLRRLLARLARHRSRQACLPLHKRLCRSIP